MHRRCATRTSDAMLAAIHRGEAFLKLIDFGPDEIEQHVTINDLRKITLLQLAMTFAGRKWRALRLRPTVKGQALREIQRWGSSFGRLTHSRPLFVIWFAGQGSSAWEQANNVHGQAPRVPNSI